MGSFIELNDTLQLTTEQGFPKELNLETHAKTTITLDAIKDKVFSFEKPDRRLYQLPPVRVFLVENRAGKWIYWGQAHILEETIDPIKNVTRGKFKIIDIIPYNEMALAYKIMDKRPEFNYFDN